MVQLLDKITTDGCTSHPKRHVLTMMKSKTTLCKGDLIKTAF